jgi:hypothetical protein
MGERGEWDMGGLEEEKEEIRGLEDWKIRGFEDWGIRDSGYPSLLPRIF